MYDWLLPAEVFRAKDCPDDDVWPCTEAALNTPSFCPSQRRFVVWEEAKKEPSPVGVPAHAMEADKAAAVESVAAEAAVATHLAELRRRQDEGEGHTHRS